MASNLENGNFQDNEYDIVIVGAGLTGLTAAYSILKRHIDLGVLILESNDTVGGRILYENKSQAFYGSVSQENISKLINELKVRTESGSDIDGKSLIFFTKNGSLLPREISRFVSGQVYYFLKMLENISTKNYALHGDLAEISVSRLIYDTVWLPQSRSICRSLLYACCGIENFDNVSALWFTTMLYGAGGLMRRLSHSLGDEKRFFLNGGFVNLPKELKGRIVDEGGTIKLSETVVKIETNGDSGLCVSTVSNKFSYVIIAVPPPASSRIAVDVPESLLRSQHLYEAGENVFFHATHREPLWAEHLLGCMIGTFDSDSCLRTTYDATHPPGQQVRIIAGLLTAAIDSPTSGSSVIRTLKKCFRTRRASRFISCSVGSSSNRDSGSVVLYAMRPASLRYHINPMRVSLERILFACSEYATRWPGTADGAIEAGETVARSIIFRARPQALEQTHIVTRRGDSRRQLKRDHESLDNNSGIARAHLIFLGLNVCLFSFLMRDAYEII